MPDPSLPFGGHGSPCGNLPLQRSRAAAHARDPRNLPGVDISFADLADCRECDMCGECETHQGCFSDLGHIGWYLRFASPGEPACGAVEGPQVCEMVAGHSGLWHQSRSGNGWKNARRIPPNSRPERQP